MRDRLAEMLRLQHDLQTDVFDMNFQRLSSDERLDYVRVMVLGATAELHEALGETNWKTWAVADGWTRGEDAYLGELVDVWHFLMNLLLVTGRDPEELADLLYSRYVTKRSVNELRQRDGYDGRSSKCLCGRDVNDVGVSCTRDGDNGWCAVRGGDVNYV